MRTAGSSVSRATRSTILAAFFCLTTLMLPVGGQVGFRHATGSMTSSPPRYGRSTSGTTTEPSAR